MMPSDVSVVIPYHNRERYVDQAIQSVLSQTLAPLEIIIVNDGSRESSRARLPSLPPKSRRHVDHESSLIPPRHGRLFPPRSV